MQIFGWADFGHSFLTIKNGRSNVTASRSRNASAATDQRQQILFARDKISDLQKALRNIDKNWRLTRSASVPTAAGIQSSTELGLGSPTAAYLESREEINNSGASFETHGPAWGGTSSAEVTIDGEYDGTTGTGTLTFRSTRTGTVGQNLLRIEVYRPDNQLLETIRIDPGDNPGDVYTLSNGLELSLGAGDLRRNDTFTLEVSAVTGGVADPDRAFNGTRTDDANLEYGLDVTAGSFAVNGETINVAADDSINSVLAKINASAAEVTATYSALTELVTLTHNTPGSGGSVLVENDTSGFLAAMKLTGTSVVAGRDDDLDTVLNDVPRFAGVTAGDFTINGVAIAIDPGLDTLRDMIDRINASSAGVTASIDATGRYFSIVADDPAAQLILDDNGRGFFPALEITASTYDPTEAGAGGSRMSRHRANQVSELFRDVAVAINDLFGIAIPGSEPGSWLQMVRTNLQNDISGFLEGDGKSDLARIGVKFDWQATGGRVARFSGQDQITLRSALTRSPGTVANLFFADSANRDAGFIERLLATTEATDTALERALGFKGLQIDTFA